MIAHRVLHDSILLSVPFLGAVIAVSVASVAIGLLCSSLRRVSARGRHLLLSVALVAPSLAAVLAAAGGADLLRRLTTPPPTTDVVITAAPVTPLAPPPPPIRLDSELFCVLLAVWVAGPVVFGIVSARRFLRWSRLSALGVSDPDPSLLSQFAAAARDLARPPRLLLAASAAEPMVVGLLRPVILLPERYDESLDGPELAAVFAHELEHIRRRDNLTAALHEAICALFWFDPLHWLARRRLLDLRERACDERVLESGCGSDHYLSALAKSSHAAIEAPAIACMSGFHIRERMESIMSYASSRARLISHKWIRTAAATAAVAAAVALGLLAPIPSIAYAAGDPVRHFGVQLRPAADGRVMVEVTVIGPSGENLMTASGIGQEGQPLRFSAVRGSVTYQVDVRLNSGGAGNAMLDVIEDGRSIYQHAFPLSVTPAATGLVANAAPMSLELKDAELHDFLRVVSQLTGQRISADPSLQGRVTINAASLPWDVALLRALRPLGLTVERAGDGLRVVRAGSGSFVRMGTGITPPQVLTRVEPKYTPDARAARISGIVILETSIDETGVVRDVNVLKPLPMGLSEAAVEAVRQWIFSPAMLDGRPVAVVFNLTVNFRLDENDEARSR